MGAPDQNPKEKSALSFFNDKGDVRFSGKVESPESVMETNSRLKREEEAHSLELKLKYATFLCAMVLVAGTSLTCIFMVLTSSAVDKWAETTLTTIVSAFVGFMIGKSKPS
jgi:hypothetical protein